MKYESYLEQEGDKEEDVLGCEQEGATGRSRAGPQMILSNHLILQIGKLSPGKKSDVPMVSQTN